ncbi:hypothetical protein DFS34DRAFT_128949 [Phlyctochytrium arcticum]|nr:hypothetical protein DFS34DRAFT_128949 [Phlyctochytrium arcticum]
MSTTGRGPGPGPGGTGADREGGGRNFRGGRDSGQAANGAWRDGGGRGRGGAGRGDAGDPNRGGRGRGGGGRGNAGDLRRGGRGGRGGATGRIQYPSTRGGRGGGRGAGGRGGGQYGNYSGPHSAPQRPPANIGSINKFITSLYRTDTNSLDKHLLDYEALWLECWSHAATLDVKSLEAIITALARLPFSAKLGPPPIVECAAAFSTYLDHTGPSSDPQSALRKAESVTLAIQRLIKFHWDDEVETVRSALVSALGAASDQLSNRFPDHRKANGKITELFEELEKPWTIKTMEVSVASVATVADNEPLLPPHLRWKQATVGWLTNTESFQPVYLPQMRVPGQKGNGVYDSPEQYFEIILKLFVAMTFEEGNTALNPHCIQRDDQGKECARVMWSNKRQNVSDSAQCRTKGCMQPPTLVCSNRFHNLGLCESCAKKHRNSLRGPPGRSASTHIYDGKVSRASFDNRVYIEHFESRKPPQREIHWRSSRRLQSPNLVGLVKLQGRGSSLKSQDRIHWGQIADHSFHEREDQHRQNGRLAVTLYEESFANQNDVGPFQRGDRVAIIDCQTFAPEFLPVLSALSAQQQAGLPFKDGRLLNLSMRADMLRGSERITELQSNETDQAGIANSDAMSDDSEQSVELDSEIPVDADRRISSLIEESQLDPIVQIRRHTGGKRSLYFDLKTLVDQATLDEGQLKSFLGALRHPVHCTQGPPGTGKSYVGVVIVRALIRIRNLWVRYFPAVGRPPILVLSYKNHAIDEFLCDLTAVEPHLSMIRIGSCKEPKLMRFAERHAVQAQPEIQRLKVQVEDIHRMQEDIKRFKTTCSDFAFAQNGLLHIDDNVEQDAKEQRTAAIEAVNLLQKMIFWNSAVSSIVEAPKLEDTQSEDGEVKESVDAASTGDGSKKVNPAARLNVVRVSGTLKIVCSPKPQVDIRDEIPGLWQGIRHYDEDMNGGEVLLRWLKGFTPLPQCKSIVHDGVTDTREQCPEVAMDEHALCHAHRCVHENETSTVRCSSAALQDKFYCPSHACPVDDCLAPCLPEIKNKYCVDHSCFVCVWSGMMAVELPSELPPRNTCSEHPLCCALLPTGSTCNNRATAEGLHCEEHLRTTCSGFSKTGKPCRSRALSRAVPFCSVHRNQQSSSDAFPALQESKFSAVTENSRCQGITKKGKACRGMAKSGSDFCPDHQDQSLTGAINPTSSISVVSPETEIGAVEEPASSSDTIAGEVANSKTSVEPESSAVPVDDDEAGVVTDSDLSEGESWDDGDFDKPRTDNIDEIEESDHLQHLRDVLGDTADAGDELVGANDAESDEESASLDLNRESSARMQARLLSPQQWSWTMTIDERWEASMGALDLASNLCADLVMACKEKGALLRKEYRLETVKANARVYEGKTIIGGTIVGCISRLSAIRSTNPFAVLVEEASEVMEPLLFACLTSSTCKLEMIGDHLQLQPSMMSKFEFEKLNKVNVSMFERLIRAPAGSEVPSAVLSIQRRMRKNICDLTRDFYVDITKIQDHSVCEVKRIGERESKGLLLKECEGAGREVPGVSPHVFFWTHTGSQTAADVGMSRVNRIEATMVVKLAKYLVDCGVPKTSIAILTPYKGQMMLLRRMLQQEKLQVYDRPEISVRLSTVDRFQGDEADIVIASLVIDSKSRTPFVKLVNRMIVLLSRARLGMYILGNVQYFENNPVDHWNKTFTMLRQPGLSDNAEEVKVTMYDQARVGPALPLCCPLHRECTFIAKDPKDLKLGFCKTQCVAGLPCSHKCMMDCHWPNRVHNTNCQALLESPCVRHPCDISCVDLFKKVNRKPTAVFNAEQALVAFRCDVQVIAQFPCTHQLAMKCADESVYASGGQSWPVCTQPALVPYIFPECQHELYGPCAKITKLRNGTSVAQCYENVTYLAPCGHTTQVKCYLHQGYLKHPESFQCPKRVSVRLPRCLHSETVSCPAALQIAKWSGGSCSAPGVVVDGEIYGQLDHHCSQPSEVIRLCGHRKSVPCHEAFETVALQIPCKEKMKVVSPVCGHMYEAACHEVRDALSLIPAEHHRTRTNQITAIDEDEYFAPPGAHMITQRCKEQVTLNRKCGHTQLLKCSEARGKVRPCKELKTIDSPLCGHPVEVGCSQKDEIQSLLPWPLSFVEDGSYSRLKEQGILAETAVPPNVSEANQIPKCTKTLKVQRAGCGHLIEIPCSKAITSLSQDGKLAKCTETVVCTLKCGHELEVKCTVQQKYIEDPTSIKCKATVERCCWNYETCAATIEMPCESKEMPCCDSTTTWECDRGHSHNLKQCLDGRPEDCPTCSFDKLEEAIANAEAVVEGTLTYHPTDFDRVTDGLDTQDWRTLEHAEEFANRQASVLTTYKDWYQKQQLWTRPLFTPHRICGFVTRTGGGENDEKIPSLRPTLETFNGIQIQLWNEANLASLKSDKSVREIALVVAYTCQVLIDPKDMPIPGQQPRNVGKNQGKKKNRNQATNKNQTNNLQVSQWVQRTITKGYDAVQYSRQNKTYLVVWDPYCLQIVHQISHSAQTVDKLLRVPPHEIAAQSFESRSMKYRQVPTATATNAAPTTTADLKAVTDAVSLTGASGIPIRASWDGISLLCVDQLQASLVKDLHNKLQFPQRLVQMNTANPHAGLKRLENLVSKVDCPELRLLWALEFIHFDHLSEAAEQLWEYLRIVQSTTSAGHPLLLLALARMDGHDPDLVSEEHKSVLLSALSATFPNVATHYLTRNEKVSLGLVTADPVNQSGPEAFSTPEGIWRTFASKNKVKCGAMDELLKLTGLTKVKHGAIDLYKSAQAFKKLSPKAQKANALSLNYCFMGNPGTGKTTVARLFAKILFESRMRKKDTFVEVSAQKLKDEGADSFRDLINSAMDGVLFIDEAYDLDPAGDFKGKPIVSELLTAAENHRERLSIILAGYEDDINTKLFAYNDGFKSRFKELMFDDFDEEDLLTVWNGMLEAREWEAEEGVGPLVIKRLSKLANRKGFGNARAVRQRLEDACKKAMAREDFDGIMEITLEDAVGESPNKNPKLQSILEEFERKTGWKSIKETVAQLVTVCEENYNRELAGKEPVAIFLNRLFLGNPGTGKTTCAKLYGRLLKQLGFLSQGDVIFKTASDFTGAHVGESQAKTNALIESAKGKVLVIDEAYNLDDNMYGKQVLDVLVEKIQGSEHDDIVVLLLGYEEPMLRMLRTQNPGLARRFPREYAFVFEDYNDLELSEIFKESCRARNVRPPSFSVVERVLEKLSKQRALANFGNAGSVNSLLVNAIAKASARQTGHDDIVLLPEDFDYGKSPDEMDSFAPLDKLYRIDNIRQSLVELKNAFTIAEWEGSALPDVGHFVFRGSPGTGKTTVARVMASILFDLGILSINKIVETSGLDLTGEYVGHTKKHVESKLEEARGGVLFIDEAYTLGEGHFGSEALTSLVAAMTNPQYKGVVVIVAGYPKDMDDMLDRNAGLKSRFTRFFDFQDWQTDDGLQFLVSHAERQGFEVDRDALDTIREGIEQLIPLPGWGNGRDVNKLWAEIVQARSNRVIANRELVKRVVSSDVAHAFQIMISGRKPPAVERLTPLNNFASQMQSLDQQQQRESRQFQTLQMDEMKQREERQAEEREAEREEPAVQSARSQRDAGVSDEIWAELEKAKEEHEQKMQRLKEEKNQEAIRDELRRLEAIQEKIRQICPCPMGYSWFKQGAGWRCGGGSHFVSDAQLKAQFTH